jgi:ribonuclease HII
VPSLEIEEILWRAGVEAIAGIDEAGRGAWAGPVVAAAVVLPRGRNRALSACVRDSKQLTPEGREAAAAVVRAEADAIGVGVVPATIVDEAGLAFAGQLAFWRAVQGLGVLPDFLLVDGFPLWSSSFRQAAIYQGDQRSLSVAAASIVAKVTRDALMCALDGVTGGYGFGSHKGYGSPTHAAALREHGLTSQHRRSFRPVAAICGLTTRFAQDEEMVGWLDA